MDYNNGNNDDDNNRNISIIMVFDKKLTLIKNV